MTVTVVTVSDRASRGEYEDLSGPRIIELLRAAYPDTQVSGVICSDDTDELRRVLERSTTGGTDFVITTGGTGIGPRDRTPDVTEELCDRLLPGIAEAIRAESMKQTPMAMLSRGTAGMRGDTVLVNLPGSVKAVETGMRVLLPVMGHAVLMREGRGH